MFYFLDRNTKSNLAVGDLVKVFSPKFQAFYRAKILNITDNAKFHVSYIDFGNEEIMESSDIFELPDELKLQVYSKKLIYFLNVFKLCLNDFFCRHQLPFEQQLKSLLMQKKLMTLKKYLAT